MRPFTIYSFYTEESPYREIINKHLIASINKLEKRIPLEIIKAKNFHNWGKNVAQKPLIVCQLLDEEKDNIVFCLNKQTELFVKINDFYNLLTIEELYNYINTNIKSKIKILSKTHTGKDIWVDIKNIYKNGLQKCSKISTTGGNEVICTNNHRFVYKKRGITKFKESIRKNHIRPKIKEAQKLTCNDFLYISNKIDKIDLPKGTHTDYLKGYFVGFFLAEGNLISYGVQLAVGQKDFDLGYINKISQLFDYKKYQYKTGAIYLRFKTNVNKFISQYVSGNTCDTKKVKSLVFNTSINFLKGLIDGFVNGDGTSRNYIKGSSYIKIKPNLKLKNQLQTICRILGYEFRFYGIKNNTYIIKTNKNNVAKTYYSMHFAIYKKSFRKRNINFGLKTDKIQSIENIGKQETYNIEIEPIYNGLGSNQYHSCNTSKQSRLNIYNHLYFLSNGVWTHNCDADATIERYPQLFHEIPEEYDIAFHTLHWNTWYNRLEDNTTELLTGTMFFRNRQIVKDLCREWYEKAQDGSIWEQKILESIIKKYDLKIYNLPIEYTYIKTLPRGQEPHVKVEKPVIVHHQVSRNLKRRGKL